MATPDEDIHPAPAAGAPAGTVVREGTYGDKVVAVEPGGAEFIPLNERHGRPVQLFWTWTSPNLEFATIFVGVIGVALLGLGYWGNILPAGLNALTAGIGWFAVNSVSGTLALNTLTHLAKPACLVIIVLVQVVVAFFGYNLVHAFERYAFP